MPPLFAASGMEIKMTQKIKIIVLISVLIICVGMVVYGTVSGEASIKDVMPRLILMLLSAIVVIIKILTLNPKNRKPDKEVLKNDVESSKEWIKEILITSGYQADFSVESLKEIDRFIDEQNKEGGMLSRDTGKMLFALGAYVGETIIENYGGRWDFDECESEMSIKVTVEGNVALFPVMRVMSRYQYGKANSIYAYGSSLKKQ